jgi:hypothetical protein
MRGLDRELSAFANHQKQCQLGEKSWQDLLRWAVPLFE